MSTEISDELITSAVTPHSARRDADEGGWRVSWLPGRVLTRNEAVTAMIVAVTVATVRETLPQQPEQHPDWPMLESLAAEFGLTGPAVMVHASPGPRATADVDRVEPVPGDPGPAPEQVEPEPYGGGRVRPVTIRNADEVDAVAVGAAAQRRVWVTKDIGGTNRAGVTVETAAGESITVALSRDQVEELRSALALLAPLPEEFFTAGGGC